MIEGSIVVESFPERSQEPVDGIKGDGAFDRNVGAGRDVLVGGPALWDLRVLRCHSEDAAVVHVGDFATVFIFLGFSVAIVR